MTSFKTKKDSWENIRSKYACGEHLTPWEPRDGLDEKRAGGGKHRVGEKGPTFPAFGNRGGVIGS